MIIETTEGLTFEAIPCTFDSRSSSFIEVDPIFVETISHETFTGSFCKNELSETLSERSNVQSVVKTERKKQKTIEKRKRRENFIE